MATRLSEFATEVHAILNDPSIAKRDDVASLQKHDVKRRIVWITPGGTIVQPRQAGGRIPTDGTAVRIRTCKDRQETIEAHIFSDTRESTELLLDNVIAAACTNAGVLEMSGYRWETEERENSGKVLRVHECVLTMRLRFPVPDQIRPLTPVTSQTHECGTIDDDGNFNPQPE